MSVLYLCLYRAAIVKTLCLDYAYTVNILCLHCEISCLDIGAIWCEHEVYFRICKKKTKTLKELQKEGLSDVKDTASNKAMDICQDRIRA